MELWNSLKFIAKTVLPGGKPSGGVATPVALPPVTKGPVMPTVMTPKVPNKQVTLPGYIPSSSFIAAPLLRRDINAANTDISATSRLGITTPAVIRALARLNPDLSAAVSAYIRVGIPERYRCVARNPDGSFNREATQLANSIITQMDLMPDYQSGFSTVSGFRSLSEALAKELLLEGGLAVELVLDKNYMPYKLQPMPVSQLILREDKTVQGLFAQQLISGQYIDLDQPTFFYTVLDQDLLDVYSASPLEAAVQPVLAASSFLNDMRRICQRHVFQRFDIVIDEEKLRARIPPQILNDQEQTDKYLNTLISSVQSVVNNMGVEEAMVHFDFFTVKYIEGAGTDNAPAFETVKTIYDEKITTGAKTLPSILGHGSGSQNIASTETLVFMLSANGMIRLKLQETYSKIFTLAVRLFGLDVTVQFEFDAINLRPESELAAFRAMDQSATLEQLSLGFLTDDEAALKLTGRLTPPGFKPLSGTGFYKAAGGAAAPVDPNANPLGNKQGALQQNLSPDTPKQPKS